MKKSIFILFLTLAASVGTIFASDTQVNGIWYNFNSSNNTASVTYRGKYSDSYKNEYSGSVIIPSTVTYYGTTYTVTSIGMSAFYDCSGLTSVTIPNSVTSIGGWAFSGCSGLTSVTIPSSVTSLRHGIVSNCTSLSAIHVEASNTYYCDVDGVLFTKDKKTLVAYPGSRQGAYSIPNSVTSISAYAFSGCSGLTSVTIPNSVTSIEEGAFDGCNNLRGININDLAAWCKIYFWDDGDVTQSNPLEIAGHLYLNNREITNLVIPNSVTRIGSWAFVGCRSITSVTIPNSVTSIGSNAFCCCSGLTSVAIPNSVTSIESRTFRSCTGLTSVTIPESVTSIGGQAFDNCSALTSVTIPNSVTSIGYDAFYGVANIVYTGTATWNEVDKWWGARNMNGHVDGLLVYNDETKSSLIACSRNATGEIIIPNSVTSISAYAFSGCSGLTSVTIPNSVTSISAYAFSGCSGLTSVTIPNSVTSIGYDAFYGVANIVYTGTATYGDYDKWWGAQSLNGYVDGLLVYSDNTKTILLACLSTVIGDITIPNSVTSIEERAFYNCSSLASVTVPNSVSWIGYNAFYDVANIVYTGNATWETEESTGRNNPRWGARNMNGYVDGWFVYSDDTKTTLLACSSAATGDITIPNSVTSISERAFYYCNNLTSVTIPNSVTSIGENAFNQETIYCQSDIPADIQANTFPVSSTIHVPDCALSNYNSAFIWQGLNIVPVQINMLVADETGGSVVNNCGRNEVEAIPFDGYRFNQWSDGITDNPRSYSLTQSPQTFTAEFVKTYAITCGTSPYGTTTGGGAYDYLTEITLMAEPNYGYKFKQWSDGEKANPRIVLVEQDSVFTAEYAPLNYQVAVKTANRKMGTVQPNSAEWPYLSEVELVATPKKGYHFTNWSDGSEQNPYTITVTQDTVFTANFAINSYNVNILGSSYGTSAGAGTYDYLSDIEIEAIPNYGYRFMQWSDDVTENPRILTVESDTTLSMVFEQITYVLRTTSNDEQMGSVTPAEGKYAFMSEVTITAEPAYGYHFEEWNDGRVANPRTITIESDTAFEAIFELNTYSIQVTSSPRGRISGAGEYDYLEECTLRAIPNSGYKFVRWKDGETANPRTFVVTQDSIFAAVFESTNAEIFLVQFLDWDGTELKKENVTQGSAATAPEDPTREGYIFIGWDKSFDNITSDLVVTALYERNLSYLPITYTDGLDETLIDAEALMLNLPEAPAHNGYVFVGWEIESASMEAGIVIRAVYMQDTPSGNENPFEAPQAQKTYYKGNVYILREGKTYTVTGAEVK